MTGNILEAIQGFATPAMIAAATSTLGLDDKQASGALGAAVTSILGGALSKSKDVGALTQIASLASAVTPDPGLFSNIAGMLGGGLPASALQILGNRLLGQVFGSNQAAAISALAAAMGISGKAASSLMTLAAPMVLAAIRSKLGPAPTAAGVASLLNQDRNLIAQAMPAPLRTTYGLADLSPAKSAAATPSAAPAASAAATAAPAVVSTAAGPVPASVAAMPAAHTPSGHASVASGPVTTASQSAQVVAATATAATMAAATAPASTAANRPVPVVRRDDDTNPYYVPILLAAALLVGLPLLWYATIPPPAPNKTSASAAAPASPGPANAAKPLLGQPSGNGLKYTLPGGATIEVAKNGVEQKLIEFITSATAIDKKMWFDFDRLGFETGSSDVTAASRAQLEALTAILKAFPAAKVRIGGYTDNQGDPQANLKLSESRAKRVTEELVKLGIAANRLESEGYGEQFPIGDNATAEGRAKNRRTALSVRAK